MNREFVFENTGNYDEWLIEQLRDPEIALSYLETALEEFEADNDFNALRIATLNFFRAQYFRIKLGNSTGIEERTLEQSLEFTSCQYLFDLSQDLSFSDTSLGNRGLSKSKEPNVHNLDRFPSEGLVDIGVIYV